MCVIGTMKTLRRCKPMTLVSYKYCLNIKREFKKYQNDNFFTTKNA